MARLALVALLGLALGAGAHFAAIERDPPCEARLDHGTLRGDGVFLAVAGAGCGGRRECTVGDATRAIAREIVPAGVRQDCVAFNQYIGAGLNAIPGYVTGECYGYAEVDGRRMYPRRRCVRRR